MATVVALCVDHAQTGPFMRARAFPALVSAAKALAGQWGALALTIHSTNGQQANSTDRLLKRNGAELVGGTYVV